MYRLLNVATPFVTVDWMATELLETTLVRVPSAPEVRAAVITVELS
jgi:hypothetical protein